MHEQNWMVILGFQNGIIIEGMNDLYVGILIFGRDVFLD